MAEIVRTPESSLALTDIRTVPDKSGPVGPNFVGPVQLYFLMESKYSALAPILIQIERSKPVDY